MRELRAFSTVGLCFSDIDEWLSGDDEPENSAKRKENIKPFSLFLSGVDRRYRFHRSRSSSTPWSWAFLQSKSAWIPPSRPAASRPVHHAIRNCYCLMMSSPYLNEFLNECLIYYGTERMRYLQSRLMGGADTRNMWDSLPNRIISIAWRATRRIQSLITWTSIVIA